MKHPDWAGSVVGLDVSLTGPGICIAVGDPRTSCDGDKLDCESVLIRAGEDLRGSARLSAVTKAIFGWLQARRGSIQPGDLFVTEGYAFSAQNAHSLGEIGGCIRKVIWEAGANLLIIPPMTLKRFITGKGAGEKSAMIKAVYKRWSFDVDDDNECDAFACAMAGLVDRLGEGEWDSIERDILTNKVERYGGRGQKWGAAGPRKKARKLKRKVS